MLWDTIVQSMCTPYPPAKSAREAAGELADDIAKAVVTQTFVAHTAANLFDEEMDVLPHPSHFGHVRFYLNPSAIHSADHVAQHDRFLHGGPQSGKLARSMGDTRQQEARHLTRPLLPD